MPPVLSGSCNEVPDAPQRMVMAGNQAFALGALAGGCRFISAYPMTPATSIIEWMAKHEHEFGVVTKHAEDEIAAVCMAIGANFVGARAMTATSGGGFSLMVEALGLAGHVRGAPGRGRGAARRALHRPADPHRAERPALCAQRLPRRVSRGWCWRPAPSKSASSAAGGPLTWPKRTRPRSLSCTDQLLAGSLRTIEVDAIDFDRVEIDRGKLLSQERSGRAGPSRTSAISFADDGISPRAVPGHPKAVYATASDEHDEFGHITEDMDNRSRMMQKRMQKLETARRDIEAAHALRPRRGAHRPGRLGIDLRRTARGRRPAGRAGAAGPFPRPVALPGRGRGGGAPWRQARRRSRTTIRASSSACSRARPASRSTRPFCATTGGLFP